MKTKRTLSIILVLCILISSFCLCLTAGASDAAQSGNNLAKRGDYVVSLWEQAGKPEPQSEFNLFDDLNPEDEYYKAILWAYEWGITKGTSETTFSPDAMCTSEQIDIFGKRIEEKSLLEDAYIFTLPLMMIDATAVKLTNTVKATDMQAPINQLVHATRLATAAFKNVVTPNVDTIYSQVFFDLAKDAVVLEMPATDRFCTAQAMDAYTNTIAIIDAAQFEQETQKFLFTGPDFSGTIPEGMTQIESPTALVWVIVRTICNNSEDEVNVHEIQSKMNTYTLTQYLEGTEDVVPDGVYDENNNFVPSTHVLSMEMQEYFDRANQLMTMNRPTEQDKPMTERMAKINVGAGLRFDSAAFSADTDRMWQRLVSGIETSTTLKSAKFLVLNGVWSYMGKPIAEFGTEYAYRALISIDGLGANPTSVAVYPKAKYDADGGRLNGNNNYVIHFEKDRLPPTTGNGFWSITAYTSKDNFLIDNEIDRYCINDRSELQFNEDGSVDIYLQTEKPEGKESNWLPVTNEEFHLVMRIYRPHESVSSSEWTPPVIFRTSGNDVNQGQ